MDDGKKYSIIDVGGNEKCESKSSAIFTKSESSKESFIFDVQKSSLNLGQEQFSFFKRCQKVQNHSYNKNCNMQVLRQAVMSFCLRWNQTSLSFIFGVIVGITLTTSFFEHRFFNSVYFLSILTEEKMDWTILNGIKPFDPASNKNLFSKHGPFTNNSVNRIRDSVLKNTSIFQEHISRKTRIFAGVITAEKYLSSRALAVNNTWGSQMDGIEFFTQFGSREHFQIPVVNLEKVSDTEYPPQKKAFEILKYMCSHHLNDYEWFIRADDDVYIRVEKLRKFLSTFDSGMMIYMGQPGHGIPEVKDTLGLKDHNFCMGGPGVIFSRRTLQALCPRFDSCMEEVVSKEEDVEIGRCVTKYLDIECTHAWETLKFFYHAYQEEYTEEKPFLGNLAENKHVEEAMTLHYLKVPTIMYQVHRHYSNLLINETAQKILELRESLTSVSLQLPSNISLEPGEQVSFQRSNRPINSESWKSFNTDSVFSLSPSNLVKDIANDILVDLKQVAETAIDDAIRFAESLKFTFSHVLDGYLRSDYSRGTDYFVDIHFKTKMQNVSNQEIRVHLFRPSSNLTLSSMDLISLNAKKESFVVIVTTQREKSAELAAFIRDSFNFFAKQNKTLTYLIVASIESKDAVSRDPSLSLTIDEVIERHRNAHPGENLLYLPHFKDDFEAQYSSTDSAYGRGILHADYLLNNSQAILLLTSTDVTLSAEVLKNCNKRAKPIYLQKSRSSNSIQKNINFEPYQYGKIYQPLPFAHCSDPITSSTSLTSKYKSTINFSKVLKFIDANSQHIAPLCGRLSYLKKLVSSGLNTDEKVIRFQKSLYEQFYNKKLRLFRAPDKLYVNLPCR